METFDEIEIDIDDDLATLTTSSSISSNDVEDETTIAELRARWCDRIVDRGGGANDATDIVVVEAMATTNTTKREQRMDVVGARIDILGSCSLVWVGWDSGRAEVTIVYLKDVGCDFL